MDAPLTLVKDLVNHKRFDGFEIVSGSKLGESYVSGLQHFIAIDEMRPRNFTYIGITDSHYYSNDPISGQHFTVVFSEDTTAEKILEGLRHKKSVAVEIDENGKATCYGQLRYVLFTYFLLREYFPKRDLIAYEDGRNMEAKLLCD